MSVIKFSNITSFTNIGSYAPQTDWVYFKEWIYEMQNEGITKLGTLDINPDFQRDFVWTKKQQINYIEFILRGGGQLSNANHIYFNCKGWQCDYEGPFVLVDGKQRINAVLAFLENKLKAFGHYYNEFEDRLPRGACFITHVNNLKTRKEVLTWYIEMNTSGTPHTNEEIERVKVLLNNETTY